MNRRDNGEASDRGHERAEGSAILRSEEDVILQGQDRQNQTGHQISLREAIDVHVAQREAD